MHETPQPLEVTEPQKGGELRRIVEDDLSQIDHTRPEIRHAFKATYRVILKYRARRLSEELERK